MRFLTPLSLLLACVGHVSAQCTANTGTPSANAIIAFITNAPVGGNMGGLGGADTFCQNAAAASSVAAVKAASSTFLAFLIDTTQGGSIFDDFNGVSTNDVVNPNGACMHHNLANLFASSSQIPWLTENGGTAPSVYPWTGATVTGTANPGNDCSSWGSGDGAFSGALGEEDALTKGNRLSVDTDGCDGEHPLYCIQASLANVHGDPQFVGLHGQSFQVHGQPDEYFALISHPTIQINSKFVFLDSGKCDYNETACWTHPGTYVSELGWMFPDLSIRAVAGSHAKGLTLYVNEQLVEPSHEIMSLHVPYEQNMNQTAIVQIHYRQHGSVMVHSSLFTVRAVNSDMFFNFNVVFHETSLLRAGHMKHDMNSGKPHPYPNFPLHGLIGQTWRNARYGSERKYFQGDVDDYQLADSKLFSIKFQYNQYQY